MKTHISATPLVIILSIVCLLAWTIVRPTRTVQAANTPEPDCYCQISWTPVDDFNPPAGQTEPGDWDSEWGTKKIKVINVQLSYINHNGGCADTGTPPECTEKIRPCRKVVTADVVTDLGVDIKIYWYETNGINGKDREVVSQGPQSTPFVQTLSRPCDNGVPMAYAGFFAAETPATPAGFESVWGWEMKCGDCSTGQSGSSE